MTRRTDPATSWDAAASVQGLTGKQMAVWLVLSEMGDLTDEEIVYQYDWFVRKRKYPKQSDSGIRSRRSELRDLGWVEYTGEKKKLASGRMAMVWRARKRRVRFVKRRQRG